MITEDASFWQLKVYANNFLVAKMDYSLKSRINWMAVLYVEFYFL